MATNYDNLKNELTALANTLESAIAKYKCLILIDQYIAALTQQAAASSTDVTSYSIGNRSVTRAGAQSYADAVSRLENEINELMYGNITYPDFRLNNAEVSA